MSGGGGGGTVHSDSGAARIQFFAAEEDECLALLGRELTKRAKEGEIFWGWPNQGSQERVLTHCVRRRGEIAALDDCVVEKPVAGLRFVAPIWERAEALVHDEFYGRPGGIIVAAEGVSDAANAGIMGTQNDFNGGPLELARLRELVLNRIGSNVARRSQCARGGEEMKGRRSDWDAEADGYLISVRAADLPPDRDR